MSGLEILAVIAVIGFVIYQQLAGQALRGKRVVLLPVILTVIGFTDLRSSSVHLQSADIVCLVIGAAGSIAIGLGFGAITRLESRNGSLWAQMPVRGLWLWGAMVAWRGVIILLAAGMHAHVAGSTTTLLFTLGLNRLAQAAVIVPRAMAAGVPFAPEKDGKTFMAGVFDRGPAATSWTTHLPNQDSSQVDLLNHRTGRQEYRDGLREDRDVRQDHHDDRRDRHEDRRDRHSDRHSDRHNDRRDRHADRRDFRGDSRDYRGDRQDPRDYRGDSPAFRDDRDYRDDRSGDYRDQSTPTVNPWDQR